ncbi:hypothetical protein [Helicobacter sp. 23-1045]
MKIVPSLRDKSALFYFFTSGDFLKFSLSFASGDSLKVSPSLAEGDLGGGLKTQNISGAQFSNSDSTHPLAPSAREGGLFSSLRDLRSKSWQSTNNNTRNKWIAFIFYRKSRNDGQIRIRFCESQNLAQFSHESQNL